MHLTAANIRPFLRAAGFKPGNYGPRGLAAALHDLDVVTCPTCQERFTFDDGCDDSDGYWHCFDCSVDEYFAEYGRRGAR